MSVCTRRAPGGRRALVVAVLAGAGLAAALLSPAAAADRKKPKAKSVRGEKAAPAAKALSGREVIAADLTAGFSELEKLVSGKSLPAHYTQAPRPDMYKLPGDRDVLDVMARRTAALLADLTGRLGAKGLAAERAELAKLTAAAEALRKSGGKGGRGEYAAFRALYRRAALANPLLDFDSILFIKRYRSRYNHMCDQFLGKHAVAGGGLYVLRGAFGPEPKVADLLAGAVVQNGRLKGRKLAGGSPLLLDLSFDGKVVVFSWSECGKEDLKSRPGWGVEKCFHLWRINVDGTGLVQLTDGDLNDFDPCWLPDGRICFVSERRGGYGRCHGGRDNPSYTLASIKPDGSDLTFLSWHESNEWHPSVTNNGLIVYTRWDYVDRGTNQAHHPWVTTVDGRDARAIHGNYPPSARALHERPWLEAHVHAIPGSNKFVATAAGHHGQAYGSLILLDADVEDDDLASQLKRLTPEAAWPEAEGGGGSWTTPWPLDENYFLAAEAGNIYLLDTFGERHLICASGDVPAMRPLPLRPRPVPPLVPHQTAVGLPTKDALEARGLVSPGTYADSSRATVALMNVYDSLLPWPGGAKISALRIVQVFSKASVPTPHAGPGRTNIRQALGTVPVEPDGSAYFYAPVNKAIFFQALNERGLAVQSMRSDTYVHPGQRLVCQGCHERRWRAPEPPRGTPLALRRGPSEIAPEVEGSDPFDYDKLVGQLLRNTCTPCHQKEGKQIDLSPRALLKLSPYYVSPRPFEPSLTTPGKFGAMGSKLLALMDKAGHAAKLKPAEYRRLTLWLDLNMSLKGPDDIPAAGRLRLGEFASRGD